MAEYENIIDLNKLGRFHNNLKDKGLPLNDWQANKEYKVDCTVIQDGKLYRCNTEHTSTTTFDDTKWSVVSSSGIPYYISNISYKVDDQVVYDNKIYKCITAHTSTSTFDDTKWEEISGRGISIWQANTDYEVNDVVIDSNLIWQCATVHTSTSTFDKSKWICLSVVPTGVQAARVTLFEGSAGNAYGSGNYTLTLSDLAKNYDTLEFDIEVHSDRNDTAIRYITRQVDVTNYKNNSNYSISFTWGYGNITDYVDFYNIPSNLFGTSTNVAFSCNQALITKITGIKYIQPDSYSTEEKLVGTWIDGKPLYRKVFTNVSDGYSTGLTSSSYTIIKYYGIINSSGYSIIIPQPYEDSYRMTLFINLDGTVSLLINAMNNPPPMSYMAVEYTKN